MKGCLSYSIKYNCLKGLLRTGLCLFLIVFFAMLSHAQVVAVKAGTDKSKILLGEPFWLTLEVKTLNNATVNPFKVDSIAHFEFIVKDSASTTQNGDTTIFRQYYQLTSFDSGKWVIPSFTLRPFVKTNSLLVDVVFTENFDPKQPYHDVQKIKGVPFKIDASLEKWWYPVAVLFILLTLIVYWLTEEKKPARPKRNMYSETAYKKALRSLKEIKDTRVNEKDYYAQLVEVFRTYVLERTGISSLQQTSNDLVEKLKPLFRMK